MVNFVWLILVPFVNGYFAKTHMFLGDQFGKSVVTYPELLDSVSKLASVSQFANLSVWPDKVKHLPKFRWSAPLHYIDLDQCGKPVDKSIVNSVCGHGCIVHAILDLVNDLRFNLQFVDSVQKTAKFAFLLHFTQDFHQPMHVFGPGHGGNEIRVVLENHAHIVHTNLHTLWDKYLPEHFIDYDFSNLEFQILKWKNMIQFENWLMSELKIVFELACLKVSQLEDIVHFEKYYQSHEIQDLFERHMTQMVSTLYFIFGLDTAG